MIAVFILINNGPVGINLTQGYVIGAIIALIILGYLIYSLIKPEKF